LLSFLRAGVPRRISLLVAVLLAIEILDELVFGAREAAWPLIRGDLHLSYSQIGLALSLPGITANLVEPVLGILGDTTKRRMLIRGGGLVFAGALLLFALSHSLLVLVLASCLLYPASGAFVSLSQATLMDLEPARHEQNMTRWTFAGSVGAVTGPLLLGAVILFGGGWREAFAAVSFLTIVLVILAWRLPLHAQHAGDGNAGFRAGLLTAGWALRRREVIRWILLLQSSDLMLDVMLGYLALYFVDVVHTAPADAGLAVAVWTASGLVGGFGMIPLLERIPGQEYVRISVLVELVLFPAFLLVPGFTAKLALLALIGGVNAGWYSVLQGRLYTSMHGLSGTVMTVGNVTGFAGSLVPLALGLVAQQEGLQVTMWCLLLAPVALLIGMPRTKENAGEA
jgi:MFS transporter, FSR family, fosmidomycin resistance protein